MKNPPKKIIFKIVLISHADDQYLQKFSLQEAIQELEKCIEQLNNTPGEEARMFLVNNDGRHIKEEI